MTYNLVLDKVVWHIDNFIYNWLPFTSFPLKSGTRDPFGDVFD